MLYLILLNITIQKKHGGYKMPDLENSKDLISVLWSGADILRSKMDANEYKDYLL